MKTSKLLSITFLGMLAVAGCSDDETSTTGATTATSGTTASTGAGAAGGSGGSASGGGGSGGATAEARIVAAFDPAKGELPEGLALDEAAGRAFVGFAPSGTVVSVDLESGAVTPHGTLPQPPADGFMTGLALAKDGSVYGALVSFHPEVQAGIYAIPPAGGAAKLFGSDPGMAFPNGIVVTGDGSLLVTDSAAGAVFQVSTTGQVSTWLADDLLKGQLDYCGPDLNTFDIGANGIALRGNDVLVANNDLGSIVRIPVLAGGKAGVPEVYAGPDCDNLGGADGLAVDADGTLLVAVNRQDRIARVGTDGKVTIVSEGGHLDFPASLALHAGASGNTLLVTDFALARAMSGGDPKPALLELPLE